jgi:NAD(P)-dependent dehydrogenase (short-subunit alcohol dehydrogenase family)
MQIPKCPHGRGSASFTIASRLRSPAARVWGHASTFAEQEASLTPAGGRLEPEEIAPLAVYLARDEARRVTGQAFNICGGLVMS